ncbi:hypothetical protein [Marmoricola sp. RAF53]|uniref:hypothetical protein n=1 Tax=Marmoricola sp. RAF53 TaxID=3233059 RepID=UPI003F95C9F6
MIRFVVYLLLLAAVLYGVFWAIDRRNSGGSADPARPLPPGPKGPDDDEAFLRDLERERRRGTQDPPPPSSQETHDHPE